MARPRGAHLDRAGRPAAHAARPGRARWSSTGRTCRWTPTRASPRPSPGAPPRATRRAARAAPGLRRVRGARGLPRHAVDRARGAAGGARGARPVGGARGRRGWCSSTATAATCRPSPRPSPLRAEGRDVAWFGCALPGGDAHAGRTETSILLALDPAAGPGRTPRPATPPAAELMPALRAAGSPRSARTAYWATRPGRHRRRGRAPAGGDGGAPARAASPAGNPTRAAG